MGVVVGSVHCTEKEINTTASIRGTGAELQESEREKPSTLLPALNREPEKRGDKGRVQKKSPVIIISGETVTESVALTSLKTSHFKCFKGKIFGLLHLTLQLFQWRKAENC